MCSSDLEGITQMMQGIGQKARVYRIEVTGLTEYRLHKRANAVRFVPFNKLLEAQQMIHRQGGRVASVTPVNSHAAALHAAAAVWGRSR